MIAKVFSSYSIQCSVPKHNAITTAVKSLVANVNCFEGRMLLVVLMISLLKSYKSMAWQ